MMDIGKIPLFVSAASPDPVKLPREDSPSIRDTCELSGKSEPIELKDAREILSSFDGAPRVRWTFEPGEHLVSFEDFFDRSVIPGHWDTLLFGTRNNELHAIDRKTGEKRWDFKTGSPVVTSPVAGPDGKVYFGVEETVRRKGEEEKKWKICVLDGKTGEKRLEFPVGGRITSPLTIHRDGTLYYGSHPDTFTAVDGNSGETRWKLRSRGCFGSPPLIGADNTLYVSDWEGKLFAINGATGKKKWEIKTAGSLYQTPAFGPRGEIFTGTWDGKVIGVNPASGKKTWEFDTGNPKGMIYSHLAFDDEGKMYFGSDDGNIYAVDTATKEVRWKLPTESRVFLNAPMGPDGDFLLIIPNKRDGHKRDLCVLDRTSGQIRTKLEMTEYGTNYTDPVISKDGLLYMGSNYREPGRVYCIAVGRKQLMDDAIREQKAGKKEQPLIERDENFVDIGGVKLEVNMGKKRQFGSLPQIISPRKDPKH